ncbi:hypothetical protein EWI61_03075 [Methylolobus aquaticus]|nr:hypothetical protein EWI61_03075 [Methylolobus aquaticus]
MPDNNRGKSIVADEENESPLSEEQLAAFANDSADDSSGIAPPASDEKPAKAKGRSAGTWIGYLTLVIVVLLAIGGFFLIQSFRSELGGELNKEDQQVIELTRQLGSLQQQLATLHNQVAGLQTQLATEDSKIERVLSEQSSTFGERLESARADLSKSVDQIQRQLSRTRGDVLVADAEYLLSVANQKLHLVGDVKAVLAAMEAADQRLHDSGDPGVFPVREALAEEINLLKNMPAPDVVGLSAKILALEAKIREIPLHLPHASTGAESALKPRPLQAEPPTAGAETPAAETEESDGRLDAALDALKDLVTIRRTDRPIESVLTPEEVEGLRQVLLLKLEMTRAALLRGDEGMYQANLKSARQFLRDNFDNQAAATRDADAQLNEFLQQPIRVPMPDISKSLSLIRNIERLRLKADEAKKPSVPELKPQGTGAQP